MISLHAFRLYHYYSLRCWTSKPSLPAQFVLSLSSLYPGSHLHSTHFVQRESMLQLKKHFPKMQYLECWIHCCKHPPLSTLHNFCFFAIKRKEDKNTKGSLRFSYIGRRELGTFNKFKFRYVRCICMFLVAGLSPTTSNFIMLSLLHKICTRVFCVNGKYPGLLSLL